jgi:hypothetical protein
MHAFNETPALHEKTVSCDGKKVKAKATFSFEKNIPLTTFVVQLNPWNIV